MSYRNENRFKIRKKSMGRISRNILYCIQSSFSQLSYMMSPLAALSQWQDETVKERPGHPPLYALAKKRKSLTRHTYDCPRASFKGLHDLLLIILPTTNRNSCRIDDYGKR